MRTAYKQAANTTLSASLQAMRAAVLDRRTFTEVYLEGAIREIIEPATCNAVLTHISAPNRTDIEIFASRKLKTTRGTFANKQCLVFATNNGLVFGNSKMFLEIKHSSSSTFFAWIELYRKVPDEDLWAIDCPQTLLPVSRLLRSLPFVQHDHWHVLIGLPEYMHGHC